MLRFSGNKDGNTSCRCTVKLLDDNDVLECEFQSYQKGRSLLEYVFGKLNIIETDYFGLRFIDQHKQRHWLDSNKNILRQIKSLSPVLFCFRVKFYPADPLKLHEEITRYYLFLQLRRDLLHGRLYCVQNDAAILGAYIVQADLGDGDPAQLEGNYVTDYKILLKQTPKIEEKIMEIHKSLKGIPAGSAELYFLKKAVALDTYGVDPYSVKDQKGVPMYLGLSHAGVLTFQGSKKTHHFRWNEVQKLNYEGKMFIIHLVFVDRKSTIGFKCPSALACRNLWKAAVEQRLFYTMNRSNKNGLIVTGGSFFSRGSRFRYQGRCEKEVVEDSATIEREPPKVKRIPLKNIGRSTSLPNTPADSDNYESLMNRAGHRPLPYIDRSSSLDEEVLCEAESPTEMHDHYINGSYAVGSGGAYCPESTLPPITQLEPLPEDPELKFATSSPAHNYDSYFPSSMLGDSPGHGEELLVSSAETIDPRTECLEGISMNTPKNRKNSPHKYQTKDTNSSKQQNDTSMKLDLSKKGSVSTVYKKTFQNVKMRKFLSNLYSFSRVFFVTLLFVILFLALLIIFIFESDFVNLESIKSSTEMVLLRIQYYEPIKNSVLQSISSD